jgi:hypothetical protein
MLAGHGKLSHAQRCSWQQIHQALEQFDPLDRFCRAMALLIFKKIQLMFRLIGDHWLGLFSARRISSFILYTLVEIYTCGNIKTGFVYFQTEPASVSTSCKWLPVHFLSLVSNMPKKNIHENNKNHISCFFCLRGVLIPPSLLPS